MRSWDYFDTLHGRTTGVDPWRLFDLVAGEEYRRLRQAAEAASDKSWPGIFAALRATTGWSQARVDELRDREFAAELACGFPIAENCSAVANGDRIVSDTYFDADQVRRLAFKIGLPLDLEVAVAWDAKWTGRWWRSKAGRETTLHVGDNARSDVAQATAAGVQARRYTGGGWSKEERGLDKAGRWEVAGAARAARLQNPHAPGSPEAGWWDGAAGANVPFLLLAAAAVRQYAAASGRRRVYFVSRDSILLGRAYARLYPDAETGIFHASRETFRRPSPRFLTYVKLLATDTLFVDLHGTGRSMRAFADAQGLDLAYVFVCGQRRLQAHAPHLATLQGIGTGTAVEVANYHTEGRVVDVTAAGEPIRAPLEYGLDIVRVHQEATLAGLRACCRPPENVTGDEVAAAAEAVRRAVPRELLRQHQVEHRSPDAPAHANRRRSP